MRNRITTHPSCIVSEKGFTFVELLISMMLILTVGTIVLAIFLSTLRGTEKSQRMMSTRQNGNFALAQLAKSIRLGNSIGNYDECFEQETSEVVITSSRDLQTTTYVCSAQNIASDSANPANLLGNTGQVQVTSCSFTCGTRGVTPYVKISFTLAPSGVADPGVSDVYSFSNTVLLQNAITK